MVSVHVVKTSRTGSSLVIAMLQGPFLSKEGTLWNVEKMILTIQDKLVNGGEAGKALSC